jgi:hypothetical protein
MTTHTNCSHPKTKSARAACRAGKPQPDGTPARSAAERLADKAAASTAGKVGKPRDFYGDDTRRFDRKGNISGTCGIEHHDRCRVGGKQWFCTCECHTDEERAASATA